MTKTDTIGRVARPRGVLSNKTWRGLEDARLNLRDAEVQWRKAVLAALMEGSFSEVSRASGLSKDTLQRWKREAGK